MTFALGARARDYVITYTNGGTTYYLGMNGNNLQAKTTFDITCVWTCLNGNTEADLGNNSRSLRNRINSSYYLTTSCTQEWNWNNFAYTYTWDPLSVQTTASNIWRSSNGTNGNVYARISSADNRQASINVQSLTMIDMIDNNTSSSKNYQVDITQVSTTSTNPTINGNDVLTATGNYTYTASGATYKTGGYTNYKFNSTDLSFDNNNTAITPKAAALSETTWSLTANDYATINSSGAVTVNSIPTSDVTLTITATVAVTGGTPAAPAGTTLVGTKEITIQGSVPAAPTISVNGTTVTMQTDAAGTISIRYTLDGTVPTSTSGTIYNGAFDISNSTSSPVTIKAITVRNDNVSYVTMEVVKLTLPKPVITVDGKSGTAEISCSNSSATIYYTTDGSTPSATNGTQYKEQITGLATMATVKAIAVCDGWNSSSVTSATVTIPSEVSGGTVTLFDYEDHKWSYYSDAECPIHSLNPADVKITYYGNGTKTVTTTNDDNPTSFTADATGVKVGIDADANTFVYYKTLERRDGSTAATPSAATGRCAYTTIPNPFSVRPTYGSGDTRWRGFYKWRVKKVSGGTIHSASTGGATYAQGSTINAEEEIYFAPSSEYGMEVEFEALWARAYVVTSNTTSGLKSSVSYERNFVYLSTNTTLRNAALSYPVTYTTLDPSTGDGTKRTITIRDGFTCNANTKFENLTFAQYSNNAQTLTANGHDLIVGRGCTGTVGTVRGMSDGSSNAVDYTIRLESGTFGTFNMIDSENHTHSGTVSAKTIFGCDYDRAKKDNDKLSISPNSTVYGASTYQAFSGSGNRNNLTYDWLIKSGKVQSDKSVADAAAGNCIYMGNSGNGNDSDGNKYQGKRRLIMEGGEVCNIAGGLNNYGENRNNYIVNDGGWTLQIRMKGGSVRGSIFGAAAFAGASGDRLFIFTGGNISGWVAGGANGTQNTGGELYGSTSLYIGGNTVIGSESGGTYVGGTSNHGTNGADGGNEIGRAHV